MSFSDLFSKTREANKVKHEQAETETLPPSKRIRFSDIPTEEAVANWEDDTRTNEIRVLLKEKNRELERQDAQMSKILFSDDDLLAVHQAKQLIAKEIVPLLAELYQIHTKRLQEGLLLFNGGREVPPNTFI